MSPTAAEHEQDVAVYLKTDDQDTIQGITVTVIDGGREAVVVNVVGSVNTDQIADLVEKLNLPKFAALAECTRN